MEAFKICEKETKTRRTPRRGSRGERVGPGGQEAERDEDWLTEKLEAIKQMIEEAEADGGGLLSRGKRKKKKKQIVQISEEERNSTNHRAAPVPF